MNTLLRALALTLAAMILSWAAPARAAPPDEHVDEPLPEDDEDEGEEEFDEALVEAAAVLEAPQVVLIPRMSTLPTPENFQGNQATTGVAIAPDRVVVSTVGLSAQFDTRLRESPDRLAIKVASSLRDQFWHVLSWSGEVRTAKLVLISERHQIAVLELSAPFADPPPPLAAEPQSGKVRVRGLLDAGDGRRIHDLTLSMRKVGDGLALLTAPAPVGFESGMAFTREGEPLGLVVGAATPGAAKVRGPAAIKRALMEALPPPEAARVDVRWCVGAGLGSAFYQDLGTSPAVFIRADAYFARRISTGFEGVWTRDAFGTLESTSPEFATASSRRNRFVLSGVGEWLFGPTTSRLRIGTAIGAGVRIGRVHTTTTTVMIQDGCGSGSTCALEASRSTSRTLETKFLAVGGLDFLNIGPGPWRSFAGARVGYRLHLELPNPSSSQHVIAVQLQI